MEFLFLLLFCLDLFDQKEKYNFRGMQNKKPFEIILHVGRFTSLQSWVAEKSCHGQTLINECFIFDYLPLLYQLHYQADGSRARMNPFSFICVQGTSVIII